MTQNQTTSLVKTPAAGAIAKWNATPEQVQLLKNTIAKGTTDDEFALFMTVATQMELNPFLRQIHAVRRWDPEQERMVMQIQTGIDGYRLMAERSGVYGGQDGPWWCGEDGQWVDVWLSKAAPAAARVVVHRTDKPRPFTAIALWTEYAQTKKDGTLTAMWRKRGPGQLAKCAEALAFRRAFPIEIGGGAHVDVEMDYIEAEAVEQPQFVAPPPPPPRQPDAAERVTASIAEVDRKLAERGVVDPMGRPIGTPPGVPTVVSGSSVRVEGPPVAQNTVTVTDTGTKPAEPKRGPGKPPKDKAQPSETPGTDPFRRARENVDAREAARAQEQPAADPTSSAGSSPSATTEMATSAPSETASTASTESPADDGFGGEDPADSQPAPTGDPGLQLIEDLKVFLAGCKTQTEMQNGRPPFARRSEALNAAGDKRFKAYDKTGPAGEMAAEMGRIWADRKRQLPV